MKLIRKTFLLILSFSFLSFTSVFFEEEEIEYEIISTGKLASKNFTTGSYFTLDNIFEYDEFWIHVTGNTTNKPYADMHKSRLIVFGGTGTIDKVTISTETINIYTTTIGSKYTSSEKWGYHDITYGASYRLIKIDYYGNPVKWFEQVIEAEPEN